MFVKLEGMDIKCVDILTGENLSAIQVANMDPIYLASLFI